MTEDIFDRFPESMDSKTYKRKDLTDKISSDARARYLIEHGYVVSPEMKIEDLTKLIEAREGLLDDEEKEPVSMSKATTAIGPGIPRKQY
jgi:hypothetical protein